METVTSFSASLLQSLNGDTAKSAQVADKVGQDLNKKVKAHIKIDTGFGRYGFIYSQREDMIQYLAINI